MIGLIQNELIKIFSKKSAYIYPILLIIFILISAFLFRTLFEFINLSSEQVIEISEGQTLETELTTIEETEEEPTMWSYLGTFAIGITSFITLFSVIVTSQNVSAEFGDGTIKQLLIRPHRRWKVLLSKFLAVNLYSFFLILIFISFSLLIGWLFFDSSGFDKEVSINLFLYEDPRSLSEGALYFTSLLYYLPGLVMITTISFMLSTLFKSQALAVGVGIFVLFVNSTLSGVLTLLMDRFEWFKYLPFPHLDLSIYALSATVNDITFGFSLAVLIIYFLIFMGITFSYFQKRDISF